MTTKPDLRRALRAARREQVAALPSAIRGLVFHRPPAPLMALIPEDAVIGLYAATPEEAPTMAYARFFLEAGHAIALPRFAARESAMDFARFADPYDQGDLEVGPYGALQPLAKAQAIVPEVLFVPLVGFTLSGARLGQGGGHYDRWLAAHPETIAIGLAWDCQQADMIPLEPHDRPLAAVVTPTRFHGPFA